MFGLEAKDPRTRLISAPGSRTEHSFVHVSGGSVSPGSLRLFAFLQREKPHVMQMLAWCPSRSVELLGDNASSFRNHVAPGNF